MSKENVLDDLKSNIAMENFKQINRKNRKKKRILQSILVAVISSMSIMGMVLAKDISTQIYHNFFLTGQGVGTAIQEGYIQDAGMEYENSEVKIENEQTGQKIEGTDTKVKVSEFVMDDFNLSITFDVELSEKAKEIVSAEEVWKFNFSDLVISDENNVVLYCPTGIRYDEFSKEKNLGYNYEEALDKGAYIGSGVNVVPVQREGNHVKVIYNIYTGEGNNYPKSKRLNIDMTQIKISKNETTVMGGEEITLTGDWDFEVAVPEKMYNRQSTIYTQVNTTNQDYGVVAATLYDTGMELTMKIKTEKQPKYPESLEWQFFKTIADEDPYGMPEIMSYVSWKQHQTKEYREYEQKNDYLFNISAYMVNEKGEKFEPTQGPRENESKQIDEQGVMTYQAMFDLTKYNSTDKVTVHFNYNDQTEEVILQEVK